MRWNPRTPRVIADASCTLEYSEEVPPAAYYRPLSELGFDPDLLHGIKQEFITHLQTFETKAKTSPSMEDCVEHEKEVVRNDDQFSFVLKKYPTTLVVPSV